MERSSREHSKYSKANTLNETYQMRMYKDDSTPDYCYSEISVGLSSSSPKMSLSDYFSAVSVTYGDEARLDEYKPLLYSDLLFAESYELDVDINLLVWQLLSSNQDSKSLCVNVLRMLHTYSLGNAYMGGGIYHFSQGTNTETLSDIVDILRLIGRLAKIIIKTKFSQMELKCVQTHLIYYFTGKAYKSLSLSWDSKSILSTSNGYSTSEGLLDYYIRNKLDLFKALYSKNLVYGGNYYLIYQVLVYYYIITNGRYSTGFNLRKDSIKHYNIPNDNPKMCNSILPRKPNLSMMYIRAILIMVMIKDYSPIKLVPLYLNALEIEDPAYMSSRITDGGIRMETDNMASTPDISRVLPAYFNGVKNDQ
ncbi:hypothetical protein FDV_s7gp1 [Fiji disease virus]|uniref:Uncharacterized protein VP7-1 n=1 Tax=Fiji disease virus (isolate Sugarcane) TaxID=648172 RepID=VP71_FDVS|nr:hypothetical protein FDV_s7gp1 [Fiji disease virus]Q4VPH8.1 RecName: Full=Uncharacterized protein VP7-1 [Fiji disease virus isolate Sugarcane]AAX18651.1 unknown [Fiji disease virus]